MQMPAFPKAFNALLLGMLITLPFPALCQSGSVSAPQPVHVSASLQPPDARAGEGAQIEVTVTIDSPYHIYSLTQPSTADGFGPVRSALSIAKGTPFSSIGKPVQPAFQPFYDSGFQLTDQLYKKQVVFGIPVQIKPGVSGSQTAQISLHYQACTDKNCLIATTLTVPLQFTPLPGPPRPDHLAPVTTVPAQTVSQQTAASSNTAGPTALKSAVSGAAAPNTDATSERIAKAQQAGILSFLLLAVGYGFLALLTPCVFPMIPITVSFFAKRSQQNTLKGVAEALAYSAGIMGTFTVLGILAAVVFKAAGLRVFANNPLVNLALALLFVTLGINLMGGFEIVLPAALTNRANSASSKTGLLGPFFMGLTFTLTSFTCTVAFVGTLLAAAARGSLFYPVIGMLGFSAAFALPFFLLALFPQFLARLPRSGAWMVTVKGFMGFVELAAAFKFLSNADLVWGLALLTRPVFLAVWSIIALLAGLYLLGPLQLPHDDSRSIGPARRSIGALSLLVSIWLLAGINHAPLGQLDAFLPPSPYPGSGKQAAGVLAWQDSYKKGLSQAADQNRDILINFTGANCTNCRDMEQNVFPKPQIQAAMHPFVRLELYTDRERPDDRRHAALQQQLTHTATLPVYAILSPQGKVLRIQQDRSSASVFLHFLKGN